LINQMKRTILFTALCTVILFPAKANLWSWAYWYSPISYSEAKVYFQVCWAYDARSHTVYVAGEGPLPDSDENNTIKFPFIDFYRRAYSWTLVWRGGDFCSRFNEINYKMQAEPSPEWLDITIVTVDEGITHIGNWWFAGDPFSVEKVSLPSTLQSIGEGAFRKSNRLQRIDLALTDLKTIGNSAFEGCSSLSEVIFRKYSEFDESIHYVPEDSKNIGNRAFADCTGLKHIMIPANSALGDEVFINSGLESVDIENNVSFGKCVFQGCRNFKQFTVPANNTVGDKVFANSLLETVTVSDGVSFGKYVFQNCKNLNSVTFRNSPEEISEGLFQGCSSLPSIDIPNSVTSIGNSAFEDCARLPSVNIPNGVTSIGAGAFRSTGLTSINIPDRVTNLGAEVFSNTNLTSVTVPGSVKNIEHATFASCQALTSARLCEGVKTVGNGVFQDDSTLEMISLPASLDTVGGWAFANCPGLKVIECNGMTPPAMHSDAFINSDLTGTSLCVPYGSVDAYRNAPVWKDFKNIGTYPAGIHIINGKDFTVNSGSKIQLTAKLLPHDAVPAIVWTSSNNAVASVVDGTVTAYAPGEVIITATTINGIFKDSCKITVKPGNI
jgi:hypothetical protein